MRKSQKNILIHLHPDFNAELKKVIEEWNQEQNKAKFIDIKPPEALEKFILTPGQIPNDDASNIANRFRKECQHSKKDEIIMFTERILYDDKDGGQLLVGGKKSNEYPPNIGIISLEFLRKHFKGSKSNLMINAIFLNILFAIGEYLGLKAHETIGCVMDYCKNLKDIEKGLIGIDGLIIGPKFCSDCKDFLQENGYEFLLDLTEIVRDRSDLFLNKEEVSQKIFLRAEREDIFEFDFAFSFDGGDRKKVKNLYNLLNKKRFKVFYNNLFEWDLVGKDLSDRLKEIYGQNSKYVVIFVSKNYGVREWTNFEFQIARDEAKKRKEEFIIPIRLDDTILYGLSDTTGYLDYYQKGRRKIFALLSKKLEEFNKRHNIK